MSMFKEGDRVRVMLFNSNRKLIGEANGTVEGYNEGEVHPYRVLLDSGKVQVSAGAEMERLK